MLQFKKKLKIHATVPFVRKNVHLKCAVLFVKLKLTVRYIVTDKVG